MTRPTIYARYEPAMAAGAPKRSRDVIIYADPQGRRRLAIYPRAYRWRPTKRNQRWMLNCAYHQLVWLPDLQAGGVPPLYDIVQHNTQIIDDCLAGMLPAYVDCELHDLSDLSGGYDTVRFGFAMLVQRAIRGIPCDDLTFDQIRERIAEWPQQRIGRQLLVLLVQLARYGLAEYQLSHPWSGRRPFSTRFYVRRVWQPRSLPGGLVYVMRYDRYIFYVCLTRT